MSTGKVYRNIAVVQQKIYSYLTRFKNVAFQAKNFLRTTTKGPPPRCLPQGPHHPRSTPAIQYYISFSITSFHSVLLFFLLFSIILLSCNYFI